MVNLAYIEESLLLIALALVIIVLFSFFAVANMLKMNRGHPYITIMDEYIQLDPFTKSEVTIFFTDIEYLKVSEISFQRIFEIVLYDENDYLDQLSFYIIVRLCMKRVIIYSHF